MALMVLKVIYQLDRSSLKLIFHGNACLERSDLTKYKISDKAKHLGVKQQEHQ